jgi:hypothetical protein
MNKRKEWFWMAATLALVLSGGLLAGCGTGARVGTLRSESQTVELGDAGPVRVAIDFGAGDLKLAGGAEKLLEAGFTYNVARLRPTVKYADGTLAVRQPDTRGLPDLRNISDFRNEWDLRLHDEVPMDLNVNMGAGTSDLQLAGLSLTRLNLMLGAGISRVNLTGSWARDLDATIDTGAADLTVRLPKDIGVRVEVDDGPTVIEASGLTKDGNVYTNAAYGKSGVTLRIHLKPGIGRASLEVNE